jgi:hypothetical protein
MKKPWLNASNMKRIGLSTWFVVHSSASHFSDALL